MSDYVPLSVREGRGSIEDFTRLTDDDDLFLDVIDFLLAGLPRAHPRCDMLERALELGGSAYQVVGAESSQLARRVPDEQLAQLSLIALNGRPGAHLLEAWQKIYGRDPDPSAGYREAVKAVEAAAKPLVSPMNDRTTLGTIIRDLKARPDNWSTVIADPRGQQITNLIGMLELLWRGQTDRHGDEDAPLEVSVSEAQAAVGLATTLVQWFTDGTVSPRPGAKP